MRLQPGDIVLLVMLGSQTIIWVTNSKRFLKKRWSYMMRMGFFVLFFAQILVYSSGTKYPKSASRRETFRSSKQGESCRDEFSWTMWMKHIGDPSFECRGRKALVYEDKRASFFSFHHTFTFTIEVTGTRKCIPSWMSKYIQKRMRKEKAT